MTDDVKAAVDAALAAERERLAAALEQKADQWDWAGASNWSRGCATGYRWAAELVRGDADPAETTDKGDAT